MEGEPVLEQRAAPPAPVHGPSLVTIISFVFLTFNAVMAVNSWSQALGAISFVAFSYLDFILLVYCLALYEGTPPGSPRREHLKVAVWLLATMLFFALGALTEFWFLVVAKVTENSSTLTFQNHTSCAQLCHLYLPAVP